MIQPSHKGQYNTVLALFVMDNEGYRYTFIILNVYFFSTATIVMRMHVSVMCIHMLSVLLYVSVALILASGLL